MPPIAVTTTTHIDPSEQTIRGVMQTILEQKAARHSKLGEHQEAEQIRLQVVEVKIQAFGPDSPEVALTKTRLGEDQLQLGKLDEAEETLRHAVRIRNKNPLVHPFDAAVSRENLAQVLEAKGDLAGAKEV